MFTLRKIEGGRINVCEPQILTVGAAAVVSGQALVLDSNGALVKCSGNKPTFIALANAAAGEKVAVGRVESNQIYSVSAEGLTLIVGLKYKPNDGGTALTATTGGSAEVVEVSGNTAYVRFS